MSFLEPSPVLLTFIFVQRFVFFEVLAIFALLRLLVGRGFVRLPALATFILCSIAVFATFAPALNLQGLPFYGDAARLLAAGGGMRLPIIASAIFATCFLFPNRRWYWLDVLHLVGLTVFLGLWAYTLV